MPSVPDVWRIGVSPGTEDNWAIAARPDGWHARRDAVGWCASDAGGRRTVGDLSAAHADDVLD